MAISKMKMHELEAAIDSVKKLRAGAEESLATKTPSKTGRPSSRPIPVEDQEDEDVVIHVPKPPAERKTKKTPGPASPLPPKRMTVPVEDGYNTAALFPGVMRRAKEAEQKRSVVVMKENHHKCNCSDCPKK
jgi:hypothetical protein